jgi:serine/threonine protein kinase, bacterial
MMTEVWKWLQRAWFDRLLKPGQLIENRYRIQEILGMGSYGLTYLAEDITTNTIIVLKQLRKTKARTKSGLRSFNREAIILKSVQQPYTPSLLNHFENAKGHFIVMDWIQGKTFEDLIFHENHVYDEKDAVNILLKLLDIIGVFHQKGIVHRDLRIPNILEYDGELHIIDFGLSCFLTDKEPTDREAHPEKQKMREISVKSDFFALGHFTLFLLYSGYEPTSKKERSWEEELSISPALRSILRKMLQLAEPFTSAAELKTALNSVRAKQKAH